MQSGQSVRRPYIYELDPLRAVTAILVIAVHVLVFTDFLNQTTQGHQWQNGIALTLHFTRAVFMFVTAFALVYVYHGKQFSLKRFWSKRAITTVLPYCLWSIIYVWLNTQVWTSPPTITPLNFVWMAFIDIVAGRASYQLYYILLTIQFYLILPFFLFFIAKVARHPWITLAITFLLQVGLFAFSYTQLQQGSLASGGFWKFFRDYQDSMFFFYIFYFVLGGLAALYYQQVSAFLLRHGWLVVCGLCLGLVVLLFHFIYQVRIEQRSLGYALSVLQPVLVFYSFVVIAFMFWLASVWALRRKQESKPKGYRFVHMLSDASFGIYLCHPILLKIVLKWMVPVLSGPVALRVVLTWCVTAVGASAFCILLLRIPVLSYLVGRGWGMPWPHKAKARSVDGSAATRRLPETNSIVSLPMPAIALTATHQTDRDGNEKKS